MTAISPGASPARRDVLACRIRLLVAATITWNVMEAAVALTAGTISSSAALTGFGLDSVGVRLRPWMRLPRLIKRGPVTGGQARTRRLRPAMSTGIPRESVAAMGRKAAMAGTLTGWPRTPAGAGRPRMAAGP